MATNHERHRQTDSLIQTTSAIVIERYIYYTCAPHIKPCI